MNANLLLLPVSLLALGGCEAIEEQQEREAGYFDVEVAGCDEHQEVRLTAIYRDGQSWDDSALCNADLETHFDNVFLGFESTRALVAELHVDDLSIDGAPAVSVHPVSERVMILHDEAGPVPHTDEPLLFIPKTKRTLMLVDQDCSTFRLELYDLENDVDRVVTGGCPPPTDFGTQFIRFPLRDSDYEGTVRVDGGPPLDLMTEDSYFKVAE